MEEYRTVLITHIDEICERSCDESLKFSERLKAIASNLLRGLSMFALETGRSSNTSCDACAATRFILCIHVFHVCVVLWGSCLRNFVSHKALPWFPTFTRVIKLLPSRYLFLNVSDSFASGCRDSVCIQNVEFPCRLN